MSKCELVIQLDKDSPECQPGETISGRVWATLGDQPVTCRALTIKHLWRAHGQGTDDEGTFSTQTLFAGEWSAHEQQQYLFAVQLPTGPGTYHGHVLNVDHYLVAEADVPSVFDPKAELKLLVPALDSPDYYFGPEYREPPPESRGESDGLAAARLILGACVGLPGLVMSGGGVVVVLIGFIYGHSFFCLGIFFALFGIPFAAVGIGMFRKALKRRRAQQRLGAPRLRVTPNPARPGERVSVQVLMEPASALTLADSRIKLIGRETAVSGGRHRTEYTHEVYSRAESLQTSGRRVESGEAVTLQQSITLPEDAATTFVAFYNDLKWKIVIEIGIEGGTDGEQEHPLTVRPPAAR